MDLRSLIIFSRQQTTAHTCNRAQQTQRGRTAGVLIDHSLAVSARGWHTQGDCLVELASSGLHSHHW